MTKLCELIASVDQMDPEDVICAKPEWHSDSEARVFRLSEDYRVPDEAKAQGYEYFLEADVVRQVMEEFRGRPDVSIEDKCKRIIHYAKFDA